MRDRSNETRVRGKDNHVVTITIAPDGRVLLHDLPAALLSVVLQLNPRDAQFRARQAAAHRMKLTPR